MQKPAPEYISDFVFHPERDTTYILFEHAAAHPFQPRPEGGVPRVNAWWLAEVALAAYQDPAQATKIFRRAGLQSEYISESATDAYVVWQDQWLAVAFRGTEPDQYGDILSDAAILLDSWTTGQVHAGFKKALDVIWAKLIAVLERLSPGRAVWFCGHSLGAAVATLAADRYAHTRGICTFGSPRVGNDTFASAWTAAFRGRSLRLVNNHDIVTHVPPPILGYRHVDPRRLIARDGVISDGQPSVPHFFSDLIGELIQLPTLITSISNGASTFTPAFLLDHMPKAYGIWIWNDYDRHG